MPLNALFHYFRVIKYDTFADKSEEKRNDKDIM